MKSQNEIPKQITEAQALRVSPAYFIKTIFGYHIDEPHWNILKHYEHAQETLDLAPRGCGKTRIGNIGYCAWLAANYPNIRILIVSDTDTHAVRFLGTIKSVLDSHPLILQYYGNLKGDKWTDHEIKVKTRTNRTLTEATISAMGMYSGAVTTGHYDVIIADDLINFDNSRTEGQRERSKEWFKTTMLPTLLPGGEIHCLGTRYHYSELWDCVQNELGYDTQIQRAIIDEGLETERSLWEWHMPLHTQIRGRERVKGLIEIRDGDPDNPADSGIGSIIFNLQYQNDVELLKKGQIFLYDWFQFYDTIPKGLRIYQGVDPAISQKDTANFFVLITIGVDSAKNIYILDIVRQHLTFDKQVEMINRKHDEWRPDITGIEKVAYQEALIQHLRKEYPEMKIHDIQTVKDKVSRGYNRSSLFENGKVFVRRDMHLFVDELVLFPDAKYDDQFDAFDFALYVALDIGKPAPPSHVSPFISPAGPGIRI